MDLSEITPQKVHSLLDYRKYLVVDNLDITDLLTGDGLYVDYEGWLGELLDELMHQGWCNPEYSSSEAKILIENGELINQATLEQIVGGLTFVVRRDRFSAGSFAEAIEDGTMLKLLNRLEKVAVQVG